MGLSDILRKQQPLPAENLAAVHPVLQLPSVLLCRAHADIGAHGRLQSLYKGRGFLRRQVEFHPQVFLHGLEIFLAEGADHAVRHGVIEIRDGLAAVHLVLVGLNRDAGQGRVGLDGIRLPDVAVSRTETVLEKLNQINLTAGLRQHIEILVMDMDVPVQVGRRDILGQDIVVHEIIGSLGAVFQHGAHGCVRVDIGVFPLDIRVRRAAKSQLLVNLHQIRLGFAHLRVLSPVEDVGLRRLRETARDQLFLHNILHLLHLRHAVLRDRPDDLVHQLLELQGRNRLHLGRNIGLADGVPYLFRVKGHRRAIALSYHLRVNYLSFFFHKKPPPRYHI